MRVRKHEYAFARPEAVTLFTYERSELENKKWPCVTSRGGVSSEEFPSARPERAEASEVWSGNFSLEKYS